jgi:sodium transport system permease protein
VFRKEVREMFRDRRVIVGAFVMPVLLIVMMLYLFAFLEARIRKQDSFAIAVVERSEALHSRPQTGLQIGESLRFLGRNVYSVRNVAAGLQAMEAGKAKLVLEPQPTEAGLQQVRMIAYYDETSQLSQVALRSVMEAVREINRRQVEEVFEAKGMPRGSAEPVQLEPKNIAKQEGLGSSMILSLLPYLIVIWAFFGGFSIAADTVAGEKERGTLETLLISPIARSEIALGKFLSLGVVCLVSSLTSLVAVLVVARLNLPVTRHILAEGSGVSPMALAEILVVLLPLVALFSGVLLAVSALARNMREAQTYLTSVSFIVMMPAVFSQFLGFTDMDRSLWVRLVPILNASLGIREALANKVEIAYVGITVVTNLALAVLAFLLALKLFSREQVLART